MKSLTNFEVEFNGSKFLLDVAEGNLMSLNTIYAAAGSPVNKDPRQWERLSTTPQLIDKVAENLNVSRTHIWKTKRGRHGGGTWAHWLIATEYASYLSAELRILILNVFRERVQEEIDPGKAIDRGIKGYRKQGKSNSWIEQRVKSKVAWEALTDLLKEREVTKYGYARCADSINVPIIGDTSKAVKREQGLKKTDSLRDVQDEVTLALLNVAQVLSKDKISKSNAAGDYDCSRVCFDVATRVAELRS